MNTLIIEADAQLGGIWVRHLERLGGTAALATTQEAAEAAMRNDTYDVIVLDPNLDPAGTALGLADYAAVRQPNARILFVARRGPFPETALFALVANLRGTFRPGTPPDHVAALVEHYGRCA